MLKLSSEFKGYEKQLKKYNVHLSTLDEMQEAIQNEKLKIVMTEERYEKQGRKNFPKKPTETKTEEIKARSYACYISSIGFFNDRVDKNYTYYGFIPVQLTCTSPSKETKITRRFSFERM